MTELKYRIAEDMILARNLLEISQVDLAHALGVTPLTVIHWEENKKKPTVSNLEKFYSFCWNKGLDINTIKSQLYFEEFEKDHCKNLFHGAKSPIEGKIDIHRSKKRNDFGNGFYCGETLRQAELFITDYNDSCIYMCSCNVDGLKILRYGVSREWMTSIAYYRGKLTDGSNLFIREEIKKVEEADLIIAPIADNNMYRLIDQFTDGELTDVQCQHCLSATNLGMQYVFRTDRAVSQIKVLEKCYVSEPEKNHYRRTRSDEQKTSVSKVKAARIKYRGIGKYIDELL